MGVGQAMVSVLDLESPAIPPKRSRQIISQSIINQPFNDGEPHSMDLKRMAILMLVFAAACSIVAYESYRFNAVAVERLTANAETQEIFTHLQPGFPMRTRVMGFFAVVFGVAGLKLMLKPKSAAEGAAKGAAEGAAKGAAEADPNSK